MAKAAQPCQSPYFPKLLIQPDWLSTNLGFRHPLGTRPGIACIFSIVARQNECQRFCDFVPFFGSFPESRASSGPEKTGCWTLFVNRSILSLDKPGVEKKGELFLTSGIFNVIFSTVVRLDGTRRATVRGVKTGWASMIGRKFSLITMFWAVAVAAFFSAALMAFFQNQSWGHGVVSAAILLAISGMLASILAGAAIWYGKIFVKPRSDGNEPRQVL